VYQILPQATREMGSCFSQPPVAAAAAVRGASAHAAAVSVEIPSEYIQPAPVAAAADDTKPDSGGRVRA
jgi:hypothetical protein